MTNTERLIASLEFTVKAGLDSMEFRVGKYTGNGPSVVTALKNRGFKVEKTSTIGMYRVYPK